MDTTEQFIKMADTSEIQKWGSYARHGDLGEYSKYQILDEMSYYAAHDEAGYYFVGNFAEGHTCNFTVGGYVRIPEYSFGCAVRGDLSVAYKPEEIIWLPTQSQLQEMVEDEETKSYAITLLYKFHRFYNTKGDYPSGLVFTSMEQLWLAFVMKEKYNKTWNGSEWITT